MHFGLVCAGHDKIAIFVEKTCGTKIELHFDCANWEETGLTDHQVLGVSEFSFTLLEQVDPNHAIYGIGVHLFPVFLGDCQGDLKIDRLVFRTKLFLETEMILRIHKPCSLN